MNPGSNLMKRARILLLACLVAGTASKFLVSSEQAPAGTYEVWRRSQPVYTRPYAYSRVMARLERGARLGVLQVKGRWGRVRVAASGAEGWTILGAPPKRAGARVASLEGRAAPSSLANAVKSFEKFAAEVARLRPDVEKLFEALRDSYLEPEDVADFAASGGLRTPGARRR